MNNKYYGKYKSHATSESLSNKFIIRVLLILASTNQNIIGKMVPEVFILSTMRTLFQKSEIGQSINWNWCMLSGTH